VAASLGLELAGPGILGLAGSFLGWLLVSAGAGIVVAGTVEAVVVVEVGAGRIVVVVVVGIVVVEIVVVVFVVVVVGADYPHQRNC